MAFLIDAFVSRDRLWLATVLAADLGRSIYSRRFYQNIDWDCYRADGERLLAGDFDYANYLCEFGYMYYPASFAYWYAFLTWLTSGRVDLLLWVHVITQTLVTFGTLMLFKDFVRGRGRLVFLVIPILAQNVYRTGISRATNDLFLALLVVAMLNATIRRSYWLTSTLFSVAVTFKMNALFYGPALLFVYLNVLPLWSVFFHFTWMGAIQVLLPLPFMFEAPISYLKLAFNFSRQFEHRLNLAWGFVGDDVRWSGWFGACLLVCTLIFLALFLFIVQKLSFGRKLSCTSVNSTNSTTSNKPGMLSESRKIFFRDEREAILFAFVIANLVGYTFSRGVHIQFIQWISYSLPYLLLRGGVPWWVASGCYLLFDWAHSWTPNVIMLGSIVDAISYIIQGDFSSAQKAGSMLFSTLESVTVDEVLSRTEEPLPRWVGKYFDVAYSPSIVPASFVLFAVECFIFAQLLRAVNSAVSKSGDFRINQQLAVL